MKRALFVLMSIFCTGTWAAEISKVVVVNGSTSEMTSHEIGVLSGREFLVLNSTVLAVSEGISLEYAKQLAQKSFAVVVQPGSNIEVTDCTNAIIVTEAVEGNFIAYPGVFASSSVLSFRCADQ